MIEIIGDIRAATPEELGKLGHRQGLGHDGCGWICKSRKER